MAGRLLGRLFVVIIGFVISIVLGGSFLVCLTGYYVTKFINNADPTSLSQLFASAAPRLEPFTAPVAVVPALLIVAIGEIMGIRSFLYYVVAAAAAAVVMPLVSAPPDGAGGTYSGAYFGLVAAAGFISGFVYWLLAGRRA